MSGPLARIRDRPLLAAVVVVGALVLVGAVVALLGPDRQLSAYDTGADGASQVRLEMQRTGFPVGNTLTSPHLLEGVENPERYLLIVVGVEQEYTDAEVDALLDFVRDGGHLMLADDFGFGNRIGTEVGVTFSKRVLRDDSFRGNRSLVQVNGTLPDGRNATILTNVPTSLNVATPEAEVLARTSTDAYIDVNGNGREDGTDISDSFPVAVRRPLGDGDMVLFSDPGVFTNEAFETDGVDNREFIRSVAVSQLPSRGVVVFDESRHAAPTGMALPLGAAGAVVTGTQNPVLGSVAFVALAGSLALGFLLLDPPAAFGIHQQSLDEVRRPRPDDRRLGHRLRVMALQVVAATHDLRGDREEVLEEARSVVEDPALRSLLEADEPTVSPDEGEDLLERIESYEPGATAKREEVTA